MADERLAARVLVGPRSLDDRICRLMYVRETDEMWTEVWNERAWERASLLARYVLKAPVPPAAALDRQGIPAERGEWDRDAVHA
jgi:hypothetical protein